MTNLENRLWAELYQRLEFLLNRYASKEYLIGLLALPIPSDRFPDFDSISPILSNSTGWSLYPVSGFLEEKLFYDINKMNKHAFSKDVTDNVVTRGSFLESFLSSLRNKMRANSPRNKKK